MVSFISLSKFLLFINVASAFIMPPSLSINNLPVRINRNYNSLTKINLKLDNNAKIGIDTIGIITYDYILENTCNLHFPQSFIYSFILYYLLLFLISKLKNK
jgi:hypothetical protein